MKKQMFGAILLSAALAVGTAMPAFAEVDSSLDTNISDDAYTISSLAGSAQTAVHVQTSITQINVTVPMKVVLGAQAAGGELTTPTTDLYAIKSTTPANVYVQQAVITESDATKWALVAGSGTTAFKPATNVDAGHVAPSSVHYGQLSIGITGLDARNCVALKTGTTTVTLANAATSASAQGGVLDAYDGTTGTPTELPINFEGTSTILNNIDGDGVAASEAFKIVYTVSVQPNTATTMVVA